MDQGLTGINRERPGLGEALAAGRAGDTSPGRGGARPHRPGRAAAVQRAGHGGGVRGRPHPHADTGRDESGQSQGTTARQAAEAQRARRRTSSHYTVPVDTPCRSWATCSGSLVRPSTARSSETRYAGAPSSPVDPTWAARSPEPSPKPVALTDVASRSGRVAQDAPGQQPFRVSDDSSCRRMWVSMRRPTGVLRFVPRTGGSLPGAGSAGGVTRGSSRRPGRRCSSCGDSVRHSACGSFPQAVGAGRSGRR